MTKDCRDTALNYLKHRARSVFEVKSHLLSGGFPEEEINEALRYLQEYRYLDDAEYCSDYIRYGVRKGRGPVRLQRELAEKGIEAGLIRRALDESFDRQTEKEAAMKEAGKLLERAVKASAASGSGPAGETEDGCGTGWPDEKTIAGIGRKLASLGYHSEVIYDIIGRLRK